MNIIFRVGKHDYYGLRVAISSWLFPGVGHQLELKIAHLAHRIEALEKDLDKKLDWLVKMKELKNSMEKEKTPGT